MEITFCDRCDASIPRSDVERRVAGREDGLLLCAVCRKASRRNRLGRLVTLPLAIVFAALAGAAIALLVLVPRLRLLEAALTDVRGEVRGLATEDPGVAAELEGLRELAVAQSDAFATLADEIREEVGTIGRSVKTVAGQVGDLAGEVRSLKAWAASEPEPELPAPPPEGEAGPPEIDVNLWLELTGDDDPGVRFSALDELAKTDDPRIRGRAQELLADADPTVRARAAEMLGEYGETSAIGDLAGLLSDSNIRVRSVAHDAVVKLVGPVPGYDPTDPAEARAKAVAEFLDAIR